MKRRRPHNKRLTSDKDHRKKYFVEGVVKRGSNETWIAIRSSLSRFVKVIMLAALAGGIYYGVTQGWRKFFWKNPDYALSEIHFTTDGTLTREQACVTAKLKAGENIMSYNRAAVRDALQALPQVESAEVTRYLPNRIEIAVRERKPTAWLASAPGDKPGAGEPTHLLDARGMVFQPKHIPHEFRTLPTIAGVQTEDLEPGKPIHKAEVIAALELLKRTRETGMFKVVSIDVSKAYCLVATDHKRAQLTFGLDDIAEQLDRLSAVRGEATLIGQEIQTVNLIPKRNIPVTFMQPTQQEIDDGEPPPPVARVIAKPKTDTPTKEKARPASRRSEPSKKETPAKDGGLLKRFRTA